jgi:ABC-2 type transport system ATP-binding protein
MSYAIEVSELYKTFTVQRARRTGLMGRVRDMVAPQRDTIVAVDHISFSIAQGESVAFIGPNGAGKSTTLKVLSGILYPDAGHASVLGFVPWQQRLRRYASGSRFGVWG